MTKRKTALAIAGSLRSNSYNYQLLEELGKRSAEHFDMVFFNDLATIPMFNEDLKPIDQRPPAITAMLEKVEAADIIILATPEYCVSIPGVLKNLLDWISVDRSLEHKPVGILGGTTGVWGTRDAQAHLRQILLSMGANTMPRPNVFVNDIENQLAELKANKPTQTAKRLQAFGKALGDWTNQMT
jgi:chromate reductase